VLINVLKNNALTAPILCFCYDNVRLAVCMYVLLFQNNGNGKPPYPKSVGFIIGTEFCERFSYYGMRGL